MRYFILTDAKDHYLHHEAGGIVSWFGINSDSICKFDTKVEAKEFIEEMFDSKEAMTINIEEMGFVK